MSLDKLSFEIHRSLLLLLTLVFEACHGLPVAFVGICQSIPDSGRARRHLAGTGCGLFDPFDRNLRETRTFDHQSRNQPKWRSGTISS